MPRKWESFDAGTSVGCPDGSSAANMVMLLWVGFSFSRLSSLEVSLPIQSTMLNTVQIWVAIRLDEYDERTSETTSSESDGVCGLEKCRGDALIFAGRKAAVVGGMEKVGAGCRDWDGAGGKKILSVSRGGNVTSQAISSGGNERRKSEAGLPYSFSMRSHSPSITAL